MDNQPDYGLPQPPPFTGDEYENRSSNAGMNSALEQGATVPKDWKPTTAEPLPVVRCTGTVRNGDRKGERCGRWSIRGHDKCMVHGGQLPAVQKLAQSRIESAKLRIIDDADLAIDTLFELLKAGTADQVRLGAARDILDRAGVKGNTEIDVKVEHSVKPSEIIQDKLRTIAERAAENKKEADEARAAEEAEIVDAEVVTDVSS